MKLARKAHAKLNLFLEVTGKLSDGYHELYSLAVFLDLADEISVEPAAAITVSENNYNSGITDNIIYKTAEKIAREYNVNKGAKITFTKNIPIGAGLGGGSADAATTIVLLNSLWDLNLSDDEMYQLGLELGADVPVCLYSILENRNAAFFKGIGEIIAPAPKIPEMFFTLANPGIELATQNVFQNFKYEGLGYEPLKLKGDLLKNILKRSNDLETAAIELVPEIATALKELGEFKNCKLARMTGSGATSFAIFKNKKDARSCAVTMIKRHPNWQIGPVGLKEIPQQSGFKKFKKNIAHKQINISRALRDSKLNREISAFFSIIRVKTRWGRAFTLSFAAHLLALFFYDTSFVRPHLPDTQFITVAFAIENPPPETNLETAAGEPPPPIIMPDNKQLEKPKVVKKKVVQNKPVVHQMGKKPGLLNAPHQGNSAVATKTKTKDYLELLQYTVQERSEVHSPDPDLRGRAVLRLVFNRQGYVLTYKLKQKTGEPVLDKAAEKLAKNLMENPLPSVPEDFERGEEILQYDFLVSYPPNRHPAT